MIVKSLLAVVLAFSLGGWVGYDWGRDAERAKNVAALLEAEQANASETKRRITAVKVVAENLERERDELEDNLAGATDALGLMREAVRRANASGNTSSASYVDATVARALLAECSTEYLRVAGEYLEMAATADELRARVLGLQAFARTISTDE